MSEDNYKSVCVKLATNNLKEVDLEKMRQEGLRLLAERAAQHEPVAAPSAPESPAEEEPVARKGKK